MATKQGALSVGLAFTACVSIDSSWHISENFSSGNSECPCLQVMRISLHSGAVSSALAVQKDKEEVYEHFKFELGKRIC